MKNIYNEKALIFLITIIISSFVFFPVTSSIELISAGLNNTRPDAPEISGPHSGKVGVQYTWVFMSIDPDEDNITYYVDWGDQCGGAKYYGPYPSGQEVELSHTYTFQNTFTINCMAIDEFGAESNTTYFDVTVPRVRLNFFMPKILEFFSKFYGGTVFNRS